MSQQVIGVGTTANDGTGDPARTAFQKVNANFGELYGVNGSYLAVTAVAANRNVTFTDIGTLLEVSGSSINLTLQSASWTVGRWVDVRNTNVEDGTAAVRVTITAGSDQINDSGVAATTMLLAAGRTARVLFRSASVPRWSSAFHRSDLLAAASRYLGMPVVTTSSTIGLAHVGTLVSVRGLNLTETLDATGLTFGQWIDIKAENDEDGTDASAVIINTGADQIYRIGASFNLEANATCRMIYISATAPKWAMAGYVESNVNSAAAPANTTLVIDAAGEASWLDSPVMGDWLGLQNLAFLNTVGANQIDARAATYAKLPAASGDLKFIGSSAAGDMKEMTFGTGFTRSSNTINATGGGGASVLDFFSPDYPIKQSSTSGGTGNLTLAAVTGWPTAINIWGSTGTAWVDYLVIEGESTSGVKYEYGIGSIALSTGVLTRTKKEVTWNGTTYDDTSPAALSFGTSNVKIYLRTMNGMPFFNTTIGTVNDYGIPCISAYGIGGNSIAMIADRCVWTPFYWEGRGEIVQASITIATLVASGALKWGIYDIDSTGAPGALIKDITGGTPFDGSAASTRTIAVTGLRLQPRRWYYQAVLSNLGTMALRSYTVPFTNPLGSTAAAGTHNTCIGRGETYSTGLPATFTASGATATGTSPAPCIWLKTA